MAKKPLADSIETNVPHPRFCRAVYGHEEAIEQLQSAELRKRLGHAYLLWGEQGIGKASLCYAFTKLVLSGLGFDGFLLAPSTRLIEAGSHPDFLALEPEEGSEIKIAAVRQISHFASSTAAYGGWRVVLVDGVDAMGAGAANALLKILEEPPARTLFLLTATGIGRVMPTIRSRTQHLALRPLGDAALEKALNGLGVLSGPLSQDLLHYARGSVRRALRFMDPDLLTAAREISTMIRAPHKDWLTVHQLAEKISLKNKNLMPLFEEIVLDELAALALQSDHDNVAKQRYAGAWAQLAQTFAQADAYNLDKRALVLQTLRHIA